jgi:MinD-like ATPase involved in chromosome partitioning or flagellar assembly
LDALLIDPSSGLTEESLYCMNFSDMMVVMARPDQQDYQGTGLLIEILQKIDPSRVMVLMNDASFALDFHAIRDYIHKQYHCTGTAIIPHSEKLLALGSDGVFVLRYPDDPLTELYQQIANRLLI